MSFYFCKHYISHYSTINPYSKISYTTPMAYNSGFDPNTSIFHSKRKPIPLPTNITTDVTTFISARAHHGTVAFIDAATGRQVSFQELFAAVESIATSLYNDLGVRKGNVVLLLSPNSVYFPVVCLAVMSMGAVITTMNPLNTKEEIRKQVEDSKPVVAFTIGPLVERLVGSCLPIVLIGESSEFGANGPKILTTLEKMMKKEPVPARVKERVTLDDTASLLYSSGTTGESKGVVSTHRNLIASAQNMLSRFNLDEGEQTSICTIPMFHIYGLAYFVAGILTAGFTTVILSKFDMDDMLTAIERYHATELPIVPPILIAMVNNADQIHKKYNLGSLRSILCGAAPLGKEVLEGFVEKYPNVKIFQGYALTESTGAGASTLSLEESRRYGTAGMLAPSMEAKIVNPESGEALTVNQTGELWLRGPYIMKGYFCNAEATASTLYSNGWLKTGDLCYMDEQGYLFVVDRLKELMKYKGYQVPPAELEALLLTHPEIVDAAVIPYPDKEVGQVPMAYVVRKTGSNLSGKDVIEFAAKQVAPYKRVRRVAFIDSVPKNPSGKILRKDLIKHATSRL